MILVHSPIQYNSEKHYYCCDKDDKITNEIISISVPIQPVIHVTTDTFPTYQIET
jgi:hypothetical protein